MPVSCWISRYEAMGHEHIGDAIMAASQEWEGDGDSLFDHLSAICLLPDGHEGEHEFTPTSHVTVSFPPMGAGTPPGASR